MSKKKQNELGYIKENKFLSWVCIVLIVIGVIALVILGIWARFGLTDKIGSRAWFL